MIRSYLSTASSSWRNQAPAFRIMRLWLGITWIYAGWDKASDPGFLKVGSSTYIGTQLSGFSTQSPVGFAFNKLIEHAVLVGGFVMISEFAIGLATLLWVAPRLAAFGGFLMSLGLWLAGSFRVSPYFLASDTAYAVLWLSYLLLLVQTGKRKVFTMSIERRSVLRVGITGALAVAFAGAGKFFAKAAPATSTVAAGKGQKLLSWHHLKSGLPTTLLPATVHHRFFLELRPVSLHIQLFVRTRAAPLNTQPLARPWCVHATKQNLIQTNLDKLLLVQQ